MSSAVASKKQPYRSLSGWVIIDKPSGRTSTQMIGAVRRAFNVKKVGHAGTLDPLATGIVPIAMGEATKTVPFVQNYEKIYQCRIQWGEERNTDDAEGEIINTSPHRSSLAEIKAIIPKYIGTIQQTPPQFSAIKINGERAYAMARKGQNVDIKPRQVTIHDMTIVDHSEDWLDLSIECSKGTYIRSLARDIGRDLKSYGYIAQLRRTAVGPFNLDESISLDFLEKNAKTPLLDEALLPIETALDDIPAFSITAQEASKLAHGGFIRFFSQHDVDRLIQADIPINQDQETTAWVYTDTKPVALVTVRGAEIRPDRVFNV